jgi:hypothetical protein
MAALSLVVAAAGCITHLPPRTTTHLQVHWQPDYESARRAAERMGKPLLVLLVAGEIAGLC